MALGIPPQVRDYVLELSMDQQVEQTLSTRLCGKCGAHTYEANLTCHHCKARLESCAVSGYPIPAAELVTSKSDPSVIARKEDWNEWVARFSVDPVTGAPAQPMY